jgi:hypothetical protein
MAEVKTKLTEQSIGSFLDKLPDEQRRNDCYAIARLMEKVSSQPAKMWGTAIVGFGKYHYKYDSGREGEICLTGFSPRKANLTLYVLPDFKGKDELLAKLGKHKAKGNCLHINTLADVDTAVLEKIIAGSIDYLKRKYPD